MATSAMTKNDTTSEIAMFARLIKVDHGDLPPALAGYIMAIGFNDEDQARMCEPAQTILPRRLDRGKAHHRDEQTTETDLGQEQEPQASRPRVCRQGVGSRIGRNGNFGLPSTYTWRPGSQGQHFER